MPDLHRKVEPEALIDALHWRYAVKSFDPERKIIDADWRALEQALVLSPSSYGLQPWKFFVVQNTDLREHLQQLSFNQTKVTECSHYVVFAARTDIKEADVTRLIERTAEIRRMEVSELAGYQKVIVGDLVKGPRNKIAEHWAARQTYIAMGVLLTAAAAMGIDAGPMEGIEREKYDEALNLKGSGYTTLAACALGYRSADDKYSEAPKVRYPAEEVIQRFD